MSQGLYLKWLGRELSATFPYFRKQRKHATLSRSLLPNATRRQSTPSAPPSTLLSVNSRGSGGIARVSPSSAPTLRQTGPQSTNPQTSSPSQPCPSQAGGLNARAALSWLGSRSPLELLGICTLKLF